MKKWGFGNQEPINRCKQITLDGEEHSILTPKSFPCTIIMLTIGMFSANSSPTYVLYFLKILPWIFIFFQSLALQKMHCCLSSSPSSCMLVLLLAVTSPKHKNSVSHKDQAIWVFLLDFLGTSNCLSSYLVQRHFNVKFAPALRAKDWWKKSTPS